MTAVYDRSGLKFQYPENWIVADDSMDEVPRTISLQAPSGAFWSIDIHPFSMDVEELLTMTLRIMQQEYPEAECHAVEDVIAGETASGYDLFFYCLDFVVTARLRCFRHGHATFLLTYQAEDREFDQLDPVFQAITFSLFSHR